MAGDVKKPDRQTLLENLARQTGQTTDEVAGKIIRNAIKKYGMPEKAWECWLRLTPREQQVTALVCLNYTSTQIAALLSITPGTVKDHIEKVRLKANVPSRAALQQLFFAYDFSAWDR